MLIVIDEDISNGDEVFGKLGEVRTIPGRALRAADLTDADALVVRSVTPVNAALLSGSPVRFVGTVTTGVDHVDTTWLAGRGITFASAAGCNSVPVAEYVLSALLLLARRLKFDPAARALGVVGVGRIGSIVARWGEALGMQVLRCDPPLERKLSAVGHQPSDADAQFPGLSDQHSALSTQNSTELPAYVSFEQLAAAADIVTLHVPLTVEGADRTCGMVDAKWLATLKTGVILINTSRGDVVQEADLTAAIDGARFGAVVLDVWRNEPAIDAELVRRVDVATPHMAGYSVESRQRAVAMIFEALAAFAGVVASGLRPSSGCLSDIAVAPSTPWSVEVTEAVLHACDLEAVDAGLRGSISGSAGAMRFDEIRRACTKRREFGGYRVCGLDEYGPAWRLLAEVGFAK
jgi:erythronate-4-phosphate dehydrogenase